VPRRKRPERSRAPNGASSIYYSEYDKKWHGRVTMGVRDDGTPDRRHVKRATEADMINEIRRLERERDSGRVRKPGPTWTVRQWLLHWYEEIAAPSVRYKTQTYYRTAIDKYLVSGIGAHKLDRLESEHIERLYGRLRKGGAKPSTLLQIHRTLRASLNEAERRDRIIKNHIKVVRSPRTETTEIEPLTVNDAQAILAAAHHRRNGVRWAMALALGLRQGEALGLKWSDITTEWHHDCPETNQCEKKPEDCPQRVATGALTVRRAIQRQTWQHGCRSPEKCGRKRGANCPHRHGGGLVVVEPKSRAGRRVISLPPPLIPALLAHRAVQEDERRLTADLWQHDGWVFAQWNGKPIDPRADYGEWKDLLAVAGVREARLHDARHTAATILQMRGVPERAVMDVMGWSKIDMAQRYMHVPDQLRQRIATQLGGLLWTPPENHNHGTAAP
jgi:integrase